MLWVPASSAQDRVADFLAIPVDAASAGAGGTGVARPLSLLSPFENPAAAYSTRTTFGLDNVQWLADQSVNAVYLRTPLPGGRAGGIALTGRWVDHGELPRFDLGGSQVEGLRPRDLSMGLAWGSRFGPAVIGAGLRYVEEDLVVDKGTGLAFDVGMLLNVDRFRLGFAATGLGAGLDYESGGSFEMPRRLTAGLSYRGWNDRVEANLQVANDSSVSNTASSLGLHWMAVPGILVLRAGADATTTRDEFSGYRFGFSVQQSGFSVDYAFVPHDQLGAAHLIGLRFLGR